MKTVTVKHPTGSYPIYLGEDVLSQTGPLLAEFGYSGRCAVLTNEIVGRYYAGPLCDSLSQAGFTPVRIDLPDGEQHKTLDTVAGVYPHLVEAKLDRRSPIIALGGGVLGDTAGYVAASFLRGVPLVQIPTTLLAMVDSSVGGKTGVDLPQGKNLVGAFKQPEMVIVDPNVLQSLPDAEIKAGLAEVVKHGIIDSPELFETLEANSQPNSTPSPISNLPPLTWLLHEAIMVKVRVVQEDPFEQGRRAVLNLGHTFGHAFEQVSHYQIRHGEGVAMGTACAARLAARRGYCDAPTTGRIIALLDRLHMPSQPPDYPAADILAAMTTDKKRQGNTLRFILPRAIGDVDIFKDIPQQDVVAVLA
ncbi:MAG: 3-dehydroquinate synthase [Anaerolineaceae bacterium]|nr:3-dehydroquinate synthase [Anaerolineaceae bacterium]MCB9099534.1 3-dehydroquinate synthase [Anaerolineales bacterium]